MYFDFLFIIGFHDGHDWKEVREKKCYHLTRSQIYQKFGKRLKNNCLTLPGKFPEFTKEMCFCYLNKCNY